MTSATADGNDRDAHIVEEICDSLTAVPRRSFFLFAGAGSGKTRTLVEVLRRLTGVEPHDAGGRLARSLRARGQSIRIITYTRNAVEIIKGRLGDNDLTAVSTIHSFSWELIQGFDQDIREVLSTKTSESIATLEEKALSRALAAGDARDLAELEARLIRLTDTRVFTYSPDADRQDKGSLTHADVLYAAAELLQVRPRLRTALAARHPIILIDESQDTMKAMVDALMVVEAGSSHAATLGLLGDHRQRIYMDGHKDLPSAIPDAWARPTLHMNHRSQKRIVLLINTIWASKPEGRTQPNTGFAQHSRTEKDAGHVRIFVGDSALATDEKVRHEARCADVMAEATGEPAWRNPSGGYKVLALEHKLAARRGGFPNVYNAVALIDPDAAAPQGSGENKGPVAIRVLFDEVLDLSSCMRAAGGIDDFAVIGVLNRYGRLAAIPAEAAARTALLQQYQQGIDRVAKAITTAGSTIRDVLEPIVANGLFELDDRLVAAFRDPRPRPADPKARQPEELEDRRRRGWCDLWSARWEEVPKYRAYLLGTASVATHQIVKGSEFENVMVVMDDADAGGSTFSYDKVFGVVPLSARDLDNITAEKETGVDRTLRLLYVTCSRARESLALVLWSKDPARAHAKIREGKWFEEDEILPMTSPESGS